MWYCQYLNLRMPYRACANTQITLVWVPMNKPFLEKTLDLLKDRSESYRVICLNSGLSFDWLTKVAQGIIKDPSVRKIQQLHDYLQSRQDAA